MGLLTSSPGCVTLFSAHRSRRAFALSGLLFLSLLFLSLLFLSLLFLSLPFLSLPFLSLPFLSLPFLSLPFLSLPFLSLPTRGTTVVLMTLLRSSHRRHSCPPIPPVVLPS